MNSVSHSFRCLRAALALPCLTILTGCASNQTPAAAPSDLARQIMLKCAESQGAAALSRLNDVNVHLIDDWNPLAASLNPVLVDSQFRRESDEHYLVHEAVTSQTFNGPGGTKHVLRNGVYVRVWYNERESHEAQRRDAAALVSDCYRMFLFGPQFFAERNASLTFTGRKHVDGFDCDELTAVLKPGLGNSESDTIELSIDRNLHYLRRVQMTPQGLESTRDRQVEIFLREYVMKHGVAWPTSFYEQLDEPMLEVFVHQWRVTAIDFDRGLTRATLEFAKPNVSAPRSPDPINRAP